jgi:hypothetical protein
VTADSPHGPDELGPRIGYWGRSNLASFGEIARPLVFEHEIRRRLPRASIHAYAPLGPRHAKTAGDGPAPADLGAWSPMRLAELADALDCVVVGGEDVIGTSDARLSAAYGADADEALRTRPSSFFIEALGAELERRCPVAWDAVEVPAELDRAAARRVREAVSARAYLSVRDPESRDRLLRAGVKTPIAVVPDPLLLLTRAFPGSVLSRRLEFVRHVEWFPREGEGKPLVIQGARSLSKSAETIADAVARAASAAGVPVVLLDLDFDGGDGGFLDAVARVLPAPVFRVPREAALADRVAMFAHARAFVGSSPAGVTVSSAFGTPALLLGTGAVAELPAALERLLSAPRDPAGPSPEVDKRLDAHFDALAGVAEQALAGRLRETGDPVPRLLHVLRENERRLEAWRVAWESRSRQLVEGRLQLAAMVEKRNAETASRSDEPSRELSEVRDERDRLRTEVDRVSPEARAESDRLLRELDTEKAARGAVEVELSVTAAEVARWRADHERIESSLHEAREKIRSLENDVEAASDEASNARAEAKRRTGRAEKAVAELRAELERAEARLEALRAEQAEFRVTQTLLFTELAEARRSGPEPD